MRNGGSGLKIVEEYLQKTITVYNRVVHGYSVDMLAIDWTQKS